MKRPPRAGLLPLYLKLYDDVIPDMRKGLEPWLDSIAEGLEAEGLSVTRSGVCRVAPEFREAVQGFEREDVDIIITLHLAYSLSLEAIDALQNAGRPILMLDATLDESFGRDADPAMVLYNHGIHGVQDLACMFRRRQVPFEIVAGHALRSNVLRRAADIARAAAAARVLRGLKVLRVGTSFEGMGDFAVGNDVLHEAFSLQVAQIERSGLEDATRAVTGAEIDKEVHQDSEKYTVSAPAEVHRRSVRVGLGLRRLLQEGGFGAFSVNFLAFDTAEEPVDTVPFLEASKAMARGVGYAGEGDVLEASLVAALCSAMGRATFTEIFCPNWKGGSLFLSHMGEINPEVAAEKPLIVEKDFPWTPARNPAIVACAPQRGPAVLVNLAPGPEDSFRLLIAPVEVLGDATQPAMRQTIRGWVRPAMDLEAFLEEYSRLGGTHHSALLLGDRTEAVAAFARFAGIEAVVLQGAASGRRQDGGRRHR